MPKKLASLLEGNGTLSFLLILGCIEFGLATIFSLGIEPDPKNAFLFGYSFSRLVLSGLSLISAGGLLFLALSSVFRIKAMQTLDAALQKAQFAAGLGVILLAGLAVMIGLTPFETLGKLGSYFLRARPFLFVFCWYPAQFSLFWLKNKHVNLDRRFIRPFLIALSLLFALGGFIVLSGYGITPDNDHWNPAGNPLTTLQLCLIIWIGMLVFGLFGRWKAKFPAKSYLYLDILVIVCLVVGAIYLWMRIPNAYNEFSTKPAAPYFQSYPRSDAAVHDVGALSILKGSGIFFGQYTDKPLYMVFLALLHLLGGYDYNLLAILHTAFMALMVPGLYILGKIIHSRLFGFILTGIVIIRQYNGILLSDLLYFNASPRQFLTEVPTLVGLIFFTLVFFIWLKEQEKRNWLAFVAGGILGAVTLIRLNPFLLILATPVFLFLPSYRRNKKQWLVQSLSFLLGCTILIAPWIVTGRDAAGIPYFLVKFFDIIHVRYGQGETPALENKFLLEISILSSTPVGNQLPLKSGFDLPPVSIQTFPGFVINNTLHNFVGAFLSLPDSLRIDDQNVAVLASRPYWSEGIDSIAPQQLPFILFNMVFLAYGLGWAWKRWNWAGLTPLFVFVVYSVSLGLGRTSGSRYLVPIDWVANLYFALGLVGLIQFLPVSIREILGTEQAEIIEEKEVFVQKSRWLEYIIVILILISSTFIPVAQKLIPVQAQYCQPENQNILTPFLDEAGTPRQIVFSYGNVLYPEIKKDHLSFLLLTCQKDLYFEINGFHGKLAVGQQILAGLTDSSQHPDLLLIALPSTDGKEPQILWQGP
jgi:hypothetical protein